MLSSVALAAHLALTALGPAPLAEAPASTEPEAAAAPAVVVMVAEGGAQAEARAFAMIEAHVLGLELELLRQTHPAWEQAPEAEAIAAASLAVFEDPEVRGVLWLDMQPDALTLYALARDGERVYGRSIPVDADAGLAVALETLANVGAVAAVALAQERVEALATAEGAGSGQVGEAPEGFFVVDLQPPEPPEPEPCACPVLPEPPAELTLVEARLVPVDEPRAHLRLGYRGEGFASNLPWSSLAEVAAGWRPSPRTHLDLGLAVAPSVRLWSRHGDVSVELTRIQGFVAGGARFPLGRGWSLELAGRFGVEGLRRMTLVVPPGLEPAGPGWRPMVVLGADLRAGVELNPRARLVVGPTLTAVLLRSELVVDADGGVLMTPSAVRVGATAGFDFEMPQGRARPRSRPKARPRARPSKKD